MIGRLFNLLLLAAVSSLVLRALLNRQQREALHQLFKTIAFALIVSSLLLATLALIGR